MQAEYDSSHEQRRLFLHLQPHLAAARVSYSELERSLSRPTATLRSDLCRMRDRYLALLREELAASIPPGEVAAEFRYLMELLLRA